MLMLWVVSSFSKDPRLLIFSGVHGGDKVRNPAKCSNFRKAFENYTFDFDLVSALWYE